MDTITHGLSGALLGRAMSGRVKNVKPKAFVFVGALASTFPDFDFLFRLISEQSYLMNHRGITHSIFLFPLWAFIISLFSAYIFKNKVLFRQGWVSDNATLKELKNEFFLLSCISILLHITLDYITSFGTMLLSPFSDTRFAQGSVFIIDAWFTGIIILGLLISWKHTTFKPQIAITSFIILFSYVGFTQYIKHDAQNLALTKLKTIHSEADSFKIETFPAAFSPFNWNVVAYDKKTENYYVAYFNLGEVKSKSINDNMVEISIVGKTINQELWKTIPKWSNNESLSNVANTAWNDPLFSNYRWFLQVPAFNSIINNNKKVCIYFKDLRFSSPIRENPFIFGICAPKDGKKYISRLIEGVDTPIKN